MIDERTDMTSEEFKAALERERDRLMQGLRDLVDAERSLVQDQAEEGAALGEPADVATDLAEVEFELTLERAQRERLADVEAALGRLVMGTYGICQRCGSPIGAGRLRVLPWASTCMFCALQTPRRARWDG